MTISSSDEDDAPDAELELDRVGRPRKAATAFRTISEVADDLHVPQHVLRFWETRFPQVKPLKRGGGRRYYRPDDVVLLRRISDLLYTQGYTIKGVQRLLREGDGTLEGDLLPPDVADRDGDDATALAPPVRAAPERAAERPVSRPVNSAPAPFSPASPVELEARELRILLRDVLGELEAIRRQLAV